MPNPGMEWNGMGQREMAWARTSMGWGGMLRVFNEALNVCFQA